MQSRRYGPVGRMNSDDLEELAHLVGRDQAFERGSDFFGTARVRLRQARGPCRYAEPGEPFALPNDWRDRSAGISRCSKDSLEIDVRSEVLFSRIGEHRHEAVTADRLKRVALAAARMAIVDEQRDTAVFHQA